MFNIVQDSPSDSLYIQFSDKAIGYSVEVDGDILIDMADDQTVVGVDIQNVTQFMQEHRSATTPSLNLQLVEA